MRTLLRSVAGVAVLTSIATSATACSASSGRSPAPSVASLLKDKGVRYVDSGTDGHALELGGKDNDAESIRLGLQYADVCERQAAQQLK